MKSNKTNRASWYLALITLALVLGCGKGAEQNAEEEEVFVPLVQLSKVQYKTFEHKITVQGNVNSDQSVILNAEMGGQVGRILVKEGQKVSKGQALVALDAEMMSSTQNEINTQLQYAEYMLQKQAELQKRGLGSEFDYESAKSQVNSLKSKLRSVNTQKGKATIYAPFEGIIDQIFTRDGEVVGPQMPLLRLVNNAKVYLTADLSEKHLAALSIGTPVEVRFPNFNDKVLHLSLSDVGRFIEPTNRTFRVRADVPKNTDLLPNMLAELSISDLIVEEALVLPAKALVKDPENRDYVFVAQGVKGKQYKVKKVYVEVLSKYNGEAYVRATNGELPPNTWVVEGGAKGIAENDLVRTL